MAWLSEARTWFDLEQPTGLPGGNYVYVDSVPASIRAAGGSEVLKFGGPSAEGQFVIEIRHRTDVKSEWRLVDSQGRTFQVATYGDMDGSRRFLRLYCQELQ